MAHLGGQPEHPAELCAGCLQSCPANFRQVEAPQVYATVYAWLTGGSQFVNQADVGGGYNGQWIMATSRWVTKVYKLSEPLPRTGY